jgi:hypothetical protein
VVPALLVVTGPIGAGKSTVSPLVGRLLSEVGVDACVVDLDDVEFMQHTTVLDVGAWWARGVQAHASLVAKWFALGVDVVVAHGPLVADGAPGYDVGPLLRAVPGHVQISHALLRVPIEVAVERVRSDSTRSPSAISRHEDWLRGAHQRFAAAVASAPRFRWEFDTVESSADEIAAVIVSQLHAPSPKMQA